MKRIFFFFNDFNFRYTSIEFLNKNELKKVLNLSNYQNSLNIQGVKSVIVKEGKSSFSSLKIFAEPDTEVFLKITTPLIKRYYSEFLDYNKTNFSDQEFSGEYYYILSFQFRKCQKGEIYLNQIKRLNY